MVDKTQKMEDVLIRIACHELESFYIGDLAAVEKAYQIKGAAKLQKKAKYRNSDGIANPVEELKRVTNAGYQKMAGSRAIACHLKLNGTSCSQSFNTLISGILKLCS